MLYLKDLNVFTRFMAVILNKAIGCEVWDLDGVNILIILQ